MSDIALFITYVTGKKHYLCVSGRTGQVEDSRMATEGLGTLQVPEPDTSIVSGLTILRLRRD